LRYELDAGLPVSAMHNAAAPTKDQREFAGQRMPLVDDELGAPRRDFADDAIERRSFALRLDMRQIVDLVARALAELCALAARRALVELAETLVLHELTQRTPTG